MLVYKLHFFDWHLLNFYQAIFLSNKLFGVIHAFCITIKEVALEPVTYPYFFRIPGLYMVMPMQKELVTNLL
jgi:hypothetical protein